MIQDWPYWKQEAERAWAPPGDLVIAVVPLELDQVELSLEEHAGQLVDRLEFQVQRERLQLEDVQAMVQQYLPDLAPVLPSDNLRQLLHALLESPHAGQELERVLPTFPVKLDDQNNSEAVQAVRDVSLAEWLAQISRTGGGD